MGVGMSSGGRSQLSSASIGNKCKRSEPIDPRKTPRLGGVGSGLRSIRVGSSRVVSGGSATTAAGNSGSSRPSLRSSVLSKARSILSEKSASRMLCGIRQLNPGELRPPAFTAASNGEGCAPDINYHGMLELIALTTATEFSQFELGFNARYPDPVTSPWLVVCGARDVAWEK